MKLEVGRYYKTKGGERVYIAHYREDGHARPYIGYIVGQHMGAWTEDGQVNTDSLSNIVEEWADPPNEHTRWVNLYPSGIWELHHSRSIADRRARAGRTGCIKVTYAEGQFDD